MTLIQDRTQRDAFVTPIRSTGSSADEGSSPERSLVIIGGSDVDKRIELMEALSKEYLCSALGTDATLTKTFEDHGFRFQAYPLARGFDLLADFRSVLYLRRTLLRLRPQVVHCFDTKPSIVGRIAARLARVPVVVGTLPGLGSLYTYSTSQTRRRRAVFERLHALACRVSSATVFQTTADQQEFEAKRIVPSFLSHRIPGSGVCGRRFDPSRYDEQQRRTIRVRLGLEPGTRLVTLTGRLIRSKGILDLIGATPRIEAAGARVVLAGSFDSSAFDALNPAETAIVHKHALYLGERADVAAILAASSVFVFPSFYREGIPRSLVEAALMKLPIVSTDGAGCREVVEHEVTGLLVQPGQPSSLAAAVVRLLEDDRLSRALADRAREHALRNFELRVVADHHRRLYYRLTGRPSRPMTNHKPEQERIRRVYSDRRSRSQNSPDYFRHEDPAHLLRLHQRYRYSLKMLRTVGVTSLSQKRLLDVGCGPGTMLLEYLQWGAEPNHLAGIDLCEPVAAQAASTLPEADIRAGCATELPWADQSFDLVSQNTVFSSILDIDMRRGVAEEMNRVLVPGGLVLWYDTTRENPKNTNVGAVSTEELRRLFPGFHISQCRLSYLPHVARRLPHTFLERFYSLLAANPWWCSHVLALLTKPKVNPRAGQESFHTLRLDGRG